MELLLVALGGVLAIAGSVLTTWLQGRSAEQRRRRERVEATMVEVLRLVGLARASFLAAGNKYGDGPDHEEFADTLREIELHLPLVPSTPIRQEVERAIKCLRGYWGAQNLVGLTPYQSGQLVFSALSDAVGSLVRGETFVPNATLASVCAAVDEYYELVAQHERE